MRTMPNKKRKSTITEQRGNLRTRSHCGQSVVEIIIAVGLFSIIAGSSIIAILSSFSSTRLSEEYTMATAIATEGLEAAQSIRNQSWSALTNGAHGLSNSGGTWAFSGTTDIDASGRFTRTVTLSSVQRNNAGDIVASGGTVDAETKLVTASVTWNFTESRSNTVTLVQYLTNWQTGKNKPGIGGSCAQQATCLAVDTSSVTLTNGNKRLSNITLDNIDPTNAITIATMTVSWTGGTAGSLLDIIRINGSNVYTTPDLSSGTEANITNVTLSAAATDVALNYIQWTASMSGATVNIVFTMSDGSTKTVSNITP